MKVSFHIFDKNIEDVQHLRVPKCRWDCMDYPTCVYYQQEGDFCYFCIANETEFSNASLVPVSNNIEEEVYIKKGVQYTIFPSTNCDGEVYPDYHSFYFTFNTDRVTAIEFCATTYGPFTGVVAGFTLYIDGVAQDTKGCGPLLEPNPFELITFAEDEIVMQIDFYIGWTGIYNIVRGITLNTTHGIYGPLGLTSGSTLYVARGYDFLGFSGATGAGIDNIAADFARC